MNLSSAYQLIKTGASLLLERASAGIRQWATWCFIAIDLAVNLKTLDKVNQLNGPRNPGAPKQQSGGDGGLGGGGGGFRGAAAMLLDMVTSALPAQGNADSATSTTSEFPLLGSREADLAFAAAFVLTGKHMVEGSLPWRCWPARPRLEHTLLVWV